MPQNSPHPIDTADRCPCRTCTRQTGVIAYRPSRVRHLRPGTVQTLFPHAHRWDRLWPISDQPPNLVCSGSVEINRVDLHILNSVSPRPPRRLPDTWHHTPTIDNAPCTPNSARLQPSNPPASAFPRPSRSSRTPPSLPQTARRRPPPPAPCTRWLTGFGTPPRLRAERGTERKKHTTRQRVPEEPGADARKGSRESANVSGGALSRRTLWFLSQGGLLLQRGRALCTDRSTCIRYERP